MKDIEQKQLEYLEKQKYMILDNFVGALEQINSQIKDVKSGAWLKEMCKGDKL